MKKGKKFEKKVEKTINSGALWFNKTDLQTSDYCIECKETFKKGYRITIQLLEKLWKESLEANKLPYLIIGIKQPDCEYIINAEVKKIK